MFGAIGRWFKKVFNDARKVFKSFISFVFTDGLDIFIGEFSDIAMDIVESLELSDLSNDAKRNSAFNDIKAIVETKGKYYENNWIQILIPIALRAIRKIIAERNK